MNTRSTGGRRALVDESKAKDYLLVAVTVDGSEHLRARRVVQSLVLRGQSRLHMRKESETRRRTILAALEDLPLTTTVFRARKDGRSDLLRRGACIHALVRWAVTADVDDICFELDETLLRHDRQRLVEAVHGVRPRSVGHRHERATHEPLLALPDALGWAWAKGGDWRRRCGHVEIIES